VLLLRLSLARGVYSLIKDAPADWTLRIGVYGAWGEGKTTLLNLLANLAQKDGLPVARFSPSLSRDNTQLWNSFFLAVTGALGAPARPISASARARWHWQRLRAWLGKQRWFSGFLKAAEPSHPIAGPLFRLAEMATDEFRARIGMSSERVSALLSTHLANRRLLVLIDDIDRTEPALLPCLLLAVRELDVPLTEAQEPAIALEREIPRARRFEHEDDEQKLLDASDVHLRGVLVALLDTACRVGEVLSLQWKDVNLDRKEIVIEAVKAKTRTARIVPISTRLKGVLEMRRLDPAGKEFGPDAYVFGDEVGERVGSVRIAWEAARDEVSDDAVSGLEGGLMAPL